MRKSVITILSLALALTMLLAGCAPADGGQTTGDATTEAPTTEGTTEGTTTEPTTEAPTTEGTTEGTTTEPTTEGTTEAPTTEGTTKPPVTTTPPETTTPPTTEGNTSGGLSGSAQDVLNAIYDNSEFQKGMTFDSAITADNCQSYLGLTADELEQYVEDALVSNAAITTNAQQVAVIKCKSAEDAVTVKGLVAAGFDSGRWICVMPQQSFVVEAGQYVLLAATTEDGAAQLQAGLAAIAGDSMGQVDTFFTGR